MVSFVPDFSQFGLKSLSSDDTYSLIKRRIYDVAGKAMIMIIFRPYIYRCALSTTLYQPINKL